MSRYLLQQALRGRQRPSIGGEDDRLPADQEAFYEHLGSEDVVRLEPDMDQDEVFDDQFERRAHELQRTPGQDRTVSTVPNKKGPWSGNNNLGIERAFSPDANNRQTILKLPEWGFPEIWTLCLGMNDYSLEPSQVAFSVTAELEFGCGGVIQTVSVDWLQGMSVSLPMNALNVIASYRTGSGEAGTNIPSDLRLRASLVRGRMARAVPTLTYLFGPSPQETEVEIPKFAQYATIIPRFSLPGQTPFQFYSSGGYAEFGVGPGLTAYSFSQFTEYIDLVNEFVGCPRKVPIQPFQRIITMLDAAGVPDTDHGANAIIFEMAL
jgi:hypothetical protein